MTLSFGARDVSHPPEFGAMAADFKRFGARDIHHYNSAAELAGGKPEPWGTAAKTWPVFGELAQGMAEFFVDGCGTMWEADLISAGVLEPVLSFVSSDEAKLREPALGCLYWLGREMEIPPQVAKASVSGALLKKLFDSAPAVKLQVYHLTPTGNRTEVALGHVLLHLKTVGATPAPRCVRARLHR